MNANLKKATQDLRKAYFNLSGKREYIIHQLNHIELFRVMNPEARNKLMAITDELKTLSGNLHRKAIELDSLLASQLSSVYKTEKSIKQTMDETGMGYEQATRNQLNEKQEKNDE